MNLALMKEVMAVGAHVPPKNEVTQRFSEVAKRLNENVELNLPWRTDGKHSRDRFRLLLNKWIEFDSTAATTSGGGEKFGDYELICIDIKEQIDAREEEIDELTNAREKKMTVC